MKWIKHGLIFCPENERDWMTSHAANPVPEALGGGMFRIYFSCRDKSSRSSIGFLELDLKNPSKVLRVSSHPVIQPGTLGLFDDSGAAMGCLVNADNKRYLYYLGWNLGVTVPWRNSIGLAISGPSDSLFTKYTQAPIVDRGPADPFSISYPSVMRDGPLWRMWYGSNLSWGANERNMAHVIKYAESVDGIHWDRQGHIAIPLKSSQEYALSKPWVIKDAGIFKMWYSHRGERYRIGYAESVDGKHWERMDDKAGIDVSESGWDSEMIEYACVFDYEGQRYMLYNGNRYAKTGIGLAILEQ